MGNKITLLGEPKSSTEAYRSAGIVFVCLYGSFLLLTLWRTYEYVQWTIKNEGIRRSFEASMQGDVVQDKKLAVHITLALFALFEVIYGACNIKFQRYNFVLKLFVCILCGNLHRFSLIAVTIIVAIASI
jgi:hypothetical protein